MAGATDSTSSTAGRVTRVTKTNVFIGQAFATRTFDRRNLDDRSHHLYNEDTTAEYVVHNLNLILA